MIAISVFEGFKSVMFRHTASTCSRGHLSWRMQATVVHQKKYLLYCHLVVIKAGKTTS
jgi:hypothetical protein